MPRSLAHDRMILARAALPTTNPCAACVNTYANKFGDPDLEECRFCPDVNKLTDLVVDGMQYNKCINCPNQNCFQVRFLAHLGAIQGRLTLFRSLV